jgi:hypothetical protein
MIDVILGQELPATLGKAIEEFNKAGIFHSKHA